MNDKCGTGVGNSPGNPGGNASDRNAMMIKYERFSFESGVGFCGELCTVESGELLEESFNWRKNQGGLECRMGAVKPMVRRLKFAGELSRV
jgi:hypothetical protein